jgi:hypothetical protein
MVYQEGIIPVEIIEKKIYFLRSQRVMLSQDLAELYQVEPRALIQAVKRNIDRFPEDFMFQLTRDELVPLEITICDFKCSISRGFKITNCDLEARLQH